MGLLYQKEPVEFTSFEDIKKYRREQKISFVCEICGKPVIKNRGRLDSLVCSRCKTKQTKLERYGDCFYTNPQKISESWNKKSKEEKDIICEKARSTNNKRYGGHPAARPEQIERTKQTCIEKYGTVASCIAPEIKQRIEKTVIEKYGVKNVFANDEIKKKIADTNLERYGVVNPRMSEEIREKAKKTNLERYGYEYPLLNHDIRLKAQKSYRYRDIFFDSSWELSYYIYLIDNGFDVIYQPEDHFEFNGKKYIPDFKVNGELHEIKGEQFFDGDKMVNPYDRSPEQDEIYEAKHQCMIKNGVKIIREDDLKPVFEYIKEKYTDDYVKLFKCEQEFHYPNKDLSDQTPIGIIRHFHKSIYNANKKGYMSPYDAWQSDYAKEMSALNTLEHYGSCKPMDVICGFELVGVAKTVSVFDPIFAKNLISKYLNEYSEIFDPFSSFSGRMIGSEMCNKKYIGSDINDIHVTESNEIIKYKEYKNSLVVIKDIFDYDICEYECLFTCPPYKDKENWNGDKDVTMSCDEWIDLCLSKFKCKAYLFVVDETEKYGEYIVETINTDQCDTNFEKIILIKK